MGPSFMLVLTGSVADTSEIALEVVCAASIGVSQVALCMHISVGGRTSEPLQ